jgi:hypothetical protein
LNKLENIETYKRAISNRIGEAQFYIKKPGSVVNSLVPETIEHKTSTIVQVAPLLSEYDLCKVDVEGSELQVLQGMKYRRLVICEFFPARLEATGTHPAEFIAEVQRLGFKVLLFDGRTISDPETLPREMKQRRIAFQNILLDGNHGSIP